MFDDYTLRGAPREESRGIDIFFEKNFPQQKILCHHSRIGRKFFAAHGIDKDFF